MHIDYIILAVVGGIAVAGGLYLLNEAIKYRTRRQNNNSLPPNEHWLHEPAMKAKLARADEWMRDNPAADTDLDELESKANGHWPIENLKELLATHPSDEVAAMRPNGFLQDAVARMSAAPPFFTEEERQALIV